VPIEGLDDEIEVDPTDNLIEVPSIRGNPDETNVDNAANEPDHSADDVEDTNDNVQMKMNEYLYKNYSLIQLNHVINRNQEYINQGGDKLQV
jgi:hypothetical protein